MDSLMSMLDSASLGGGVQKLSGTVKVYLSEVSSPTKLWFHSAESKDFDDLIVEMNKFYKINDFWMQPNQVNIGMRIAAFGVGQWDRAEVIGNYDEKTKRVKLFFIDFGTTGEVDLKLCKILVEHFSSPPGKAFRGALHGIQPRGQRRLWNLEITDSFIKAIENRIQTIKIVKFHEKDNFYEFLLINETSSVNQYMIDSKIADPVNVDDGLPSCLTYPSFDILEKSTVYPTFGQRFLVLERHGINLNIFEEVSIPPITDPKEFKKKLEEVLEDESLANIKQVFKTVCSNRF